MDAYIEARSASEAVAALLDLPRGAFPDECVEWRWARLPKGYGRVHFAGRMSMVTHLVLNRFVGPPTGERDQAAHSCANPPCVNVNHLRWASPQENSDDKVAHGKGHRGELNGRAILTEADIPVIRQLRRDGMSTVEIGKRFGVGRHTVSDVVHRKNWAHVPDPGPVAEALS